MSSLDVTADPPRAARPAAFRRPGLVLAYAGYLLVAGFGVAAPWSALLNRTVVGYPRGDVELFDRGGVMLVEAIRLGGRGAPAAMTSSGFVVLLAGAFGLVPLAMLLAGLGREGRVRAPFLAARAVGSLGTLTLIWGLSFAAQALLGALVALLGVKLVGAFHLAPRGEALAHGGVGLVTLLALLPLGVARDLAMASAVNDATRLYTSASRALRVLRGGLVRPLGAYLARALLALAGLLVAFWIPTALRAPDAPPPIALPLLLHQLAIVGAVFLRASWLAAAIRLLDARTPLPAPASAFVEPEGTLAAPERSFAEPDGALVSPDGALVSPDGALVSPDGALVSPDGTFADADGTFADANGTFADANGTFADANGTLSSPDGTVARPDGPPSPPAEPTLL